MIYFEYLSFWSFCSSLWALSFYKNNKTIYFIDESFFSKSVLKLILKLLGKNVYQLEFKMTEVIDENGEVIAQRIASKDMFKFKEKIVRSDVLQLMRHESWSQNNILDYIYKGIVDESIDNIHSIKRVLYLINIIDWHSKKIHIKDSKLIINHRPWMNLYKEYADQYNIIILGKTSYFSIVFKIRQLIRAYPSIYNFIKNTKYQNKSNSNLTASSNKLYVDGRGDTSLSNNGFHSDFFWHLNSDFERSRILYKHHTDQEKDYFSRKGLFSISQGAYEEKNYLKNFNKPKLNYLKEFKAECKKVQSILNEYDLERMANASFFKAYDVKVLFSWFKYNNQHMVHADAIKDNGGISVIWQIAFDGILNIECVTNSDIVFSYSKFSCDIEKNLKSKAKYNVIVGYPKDYAPALLKDKANLIRSKLQRNGAKKIVFVIDENSIDDNRWHTGHEMQRDNYSYILEKLLEVPWLGVIFKPKWASTLRQRLGDTNNLLDKALKTGRCHIFEDSGRYSTSAPPILAGLAADICIHGHLGAGTAALECALEGLPTLLIDREVTRYSKLYDLSEGKVIFPDWPSTIDALMDHFNSPNGIEGFGDWSSIIDELDPYRDGMAAYRMGNYLKWLVDGFDNGLERDEVMANAAKMFRERWGHDMVITT